MPEEYLLWFHHVPWDYRMQSGRTLWDELVHRYTRGVDVVREMRKTWDELAPLVDRERHGAGRCVPADPGAGGDSGGATPASPISRSVSQRPLPAGYPPPQHSLDYYKALKFPYAPGH